MPTYDYRCAACGHTIEIFHSILDEGPEACERCLGPVQRVLHPTGVIFRGSGFYVTDSRSKPTTTEGPGGGGNGGGASVDGGGAAASSTGGPAKD